MKLSGRYVEAIKVANVPEGTRGKIEYTDLAGNSLPTDLPTNNLTGDIDPLTQTQDLAAAHSLAKAYYESLGFIVSTDPA